ncbi:toll/interleukin-1 receptor domain-containing protein [Gimesia fumaroli]|jgi:acylphosphatase|uniref:TIR domain-containing protein n=1 Tax=Gimesia fumaroli TaxID=2527976 RepID=A0A518IIZ4_9PLAN|nr:toll/interleukin-1 receptor domain-containing protein [Gimesia fumaroli]QDV53066.1 hypothetical protein Enr17x_51370 [Gimesia fumaroli]
MTEQSFVQTAELFFSYSHQDESLRDELEKHLSLLKRSGTISSWHDRRISAGSEWAGQIDESLESADVILLLVSADFVASDYCYDIEMNRALERHSEGTARVIPVVLRPVDWHSAPFAKLQALPRDAKPITEWPNRDSAFQDVARGIREIFESQKRVSRIDEKVPTIGPWHMRIEGTVEEFDKNRLDEIVAKLRQISGDVNLTISNIQDGSVIIVFEGREDAFGKLVKSYDTKSLSKLLNCKVQSVELGEPLTSPPHYVRDNSQRIQGIVYEIGDGIAHIDCKIGSVHFYPEDLDGIDFKDLVVGQRVEFNVIDDPGDPAPDYPSSHPRARRASHLTKR